MQKQNIKNKMVFGSIVGVVYLTFGLIQLMVSFGIIFGHELSGLLSKRLYIPNDLLGSLILILIGCIFLFGTSKLNHWNPDGTAFIFVGIFLALVFMTIYLIMILANAIEAYLITSAEFVDWTPLNDLKPGIYLGLLPLIGLLIWHDKFRLTGKVKTDRRKLRGA